MELGNIANNNYGRNLVIDLCMKKGEGGGKLKEGKGCRGREKEVEMYGGRGREGRRCKCREAEKFCPPHVAMASLMRCGDATTAQSVLLEPSCSKQLQCSASSVCARQCRCSSSCHEASLLLHYNTRRRSLCSSVIR